MINITSREIEIYIYDLYKGPEYRRGKKGELRIEEIEAKGEGERENNFSFLHYKYLLTCLLCCWIYIRHQLMSVECVIIVTI